VAATVVEVLAPEQWRARVEAHEARVAPWLAPRLDRRSRGEKHPVDDFLFEYYPYRPGQLRTWHPGAGVALAGQGARAWLAHRGYVQVDEGVVADPSSLGQRADTLRSIVRLLAATAAREGRFGCFGLHEWAMVYQLDQDDLRHAAWPLRLPASEIDAVVEAAPLRCTHWDAFRFFTPAARPHNERQISRGDQQQLEQPGCLHATMDLYRWAMAAAPLVASELVGDCFELARDVRTLDMQAAPYDLRGLGLEPVRVETAEGRSEFAARQRDVAARGARLRSRLLAALAPLVASEG
jgi:hypothetical protein